MNNIKKIDKSKLRTAITVILVVTIAVGIPASIIITNVKNTVADYFGTHAMNIAITVATFIEADIEPYKELSNVDAYTEGTYDQVYYEKMLGIFQEIKTGVDVDFIFTEKKLSDTAVAYVLDGEDPGSEDFSPLGSIDSMATEELKVFTEGIAGKTGVIMDEKWGEYITGYAPIIDETTGEVVGLVGVDFSLNHIQDVMQLVRQMSLIATLAVIGILSILSYYLLHKYRRMDIDYMTGLYNRRYHDKCLVRAIRHAQSKDKALSLIMIDVDNFKEINDRHGHPAGDMVLKSVAQTIRKNIRDIDICSRYAGDEFVIILPTADHSSAASLANRIREQVSRLEYQIEGLSFSGVTISIGIAEWKQGANAHELMEYADKALYLAKNSGKDKVINYT